MEQVLLQSQVRGKETQTTSAPARYRAESLQSTTALFPWFDLHSPHLEQLVLGWRQGFFLLEPGLPVGSQADAALSIPPSSPALADHSQHPPSQSPQHPEALPCLLADASHYGAERGEQGDGERGNQPGLPKTLNLMVK